MTVLTFPTNPTLGQLYNAPNQIRYVYDGVKWIVETVASTSLAVTNSVQDRVAPMFVTGPHQGISFTYNAATNALSATVNSLINGAQLVKLESNGSLTLPTLTVPISDNATPSGTGQTLKFNDSTQQAIIFGPASTAGATSAERIIIQGAPGFTGTAGEGGDVYLWAGPGGSLNGNGGDIKVRAGQGDGTGSGGYLNFQAGDSDTGSGGYINIESGYSNTYGSGGDITVQAKRGGEVYIRTYFDGGANNWLFGASGALIYPNSAVQRDTGTVTCAGNASTVVYTASSQYQHTIKLLIQVEGNVGAAVDWDTQACEMIIAKSWRANDVAATVYGIVHTSVAPLATFTAEWNALTSRIQVLCATPSANSVYVRTFATEITTAD